MQIDRLAFVADIQSIEMILFVRAANWPERHTSPHPEIPPPFPRRRSTLVPGERHSATDDGYGRGLWFYLHSVECEDQAVKTGAGPTSLGELVYQRTCCLSRAEGRQRRARNDRGPDKNVVGARRQMVDRPTDRADRTGPAAEGKLSCCGCEWSSVIDLQIDRSPIHNHV